MVPEREEGVQEVASGLAEERGWKNIFHANGKQKKAGVAILMSDEINLKVKKL